MNFKKSRRILVFEPLDRRIAFNGDMHNFGTTHLERPETDNVPSWHEIRDVKTATPNAIQAFPGVLDRHSPFREDRTRFRTAPMRSRAEGEFNSSPQLRSNSMKPSSPNRTADIGMTHPEPPVQDRIVLTVVPVRANNPTTNNPIISSVMIGASIPRPAIVNPVASNLTSNTRGTNQSSSELASDRSAIESIVKVKREAPSLSVSTEAGLVATTKTPPNTSEIRSSSSLRPSVAESNHSGVQEARVLFSSIVLGKYSSAQARSTSKYENTEARDNGMLFFSLKEQKGNPNAADHLFANALVKANHRRDSMDQVILAENERLQLAIESGGLPVPRGMIEIRDRAVAEQPQPSTIVLRASTNPFEILQMVIGSSNMMQGTSSHSSTQQTPAKVSEGEGCNSFTELTTRKDSIFAMFVGSLFAFAIRQRRVADKSFNLPIALSKSLRLRFQASNNRPDK